ncbi:LIM-domain binding protein-domain-containing protein [Absidia repens]|uniref:LIM-domain binding protein-domain-containing protein n=1 Tax=Absidia repens TaxID=90262 RepID=A0A1X2IPL7_9FUNG|nr:LIM-domain binding protein-domain-containing protein [Absidia repens]
MSMQQVPHHSPTPIGLNAIRQPTSSKSFQNGQHTGQAVLRLLQLGDFLTPGERAALRSFWDGFVLDFFADDSKLLFGVWNAVTKEQKQFELCQPLIARFFHTQYQCQLISIKLTMDQTMEYILPQGMMVDCPVSSFIYRYDNDTMVVMTGRTSVTLRMDPIQGNLKIHQWNFVCHHVEEFISRHGVVDPVPPPAPPTPPITTKKKGKQQHPPPAPKIIGKQVPNSLVNEWGLPDRVYELLKMSDAMSKYGQSALVYIFNYTPHQNSHSLQHPMNGIKEEDVSPTSPSPMDVRSSSEIPKVTKVEQTPESPVTTKKEAKKTNQTKKRRATPSRKNSKSSTATIPSNQPSQPSAPEPAPASTQQELAPPVSSSPMLAKGMQNPETLTPQQRQSLLLQQQQQHMLQLQQHHLQMQQHQLKTTPQSPYPQGNSPYLSSNSINNNGATPAISTTTLMSSSPAATSQMMDLNQAAYLSTPTTPSQRKRKAMAQDDIK